MFLRFSYRVNFTKLQLFTLFITKLQPLKFISQNYNHFIVKYKKPTTFVAWPHLSITQMLHAPVPLVIHICAMKVVVF